MIAAGWNPRGDQEPRRITNDPAAGAAREIRLPHSMIFITIFPLDKKEIIS
jgi:hypothetical protein